MTKFWLEDIQILFDKDNLIYFFPSNTYSTVKNLNSIVRLTIYIAIVLALLKNNPKYFIFPIITMIVTYFVYTYHPNKDELFNNSTEKFHKIGEVEEKSIQLKEPTVDNPFMNYNQITDTPDNKKSNKVYLENDEQSLQTRKVINEKFNEKLYRDVSDLYGRRNSQREFYTVAYNHVPDQTSFAKWCYSTPPTCKEKNINCAPATGRMF